MSQEDILNVLKKYNKPMSRSEIAKVLSDDLVHVSHLIFKLIKSNHIKIIEIDRYEAMKRCNCKKRTRLYYI